MIKTLLAAALIAAFTSASARTIKSCTEIAWDYPEQEIPLIDGFNVYVNGTKVGSVLPPEQTIACSTIGLNNHGIFVVEVTAYNAVGESAKSDPLSVAVVTAAPTVPTGLTAH